MFENIHLWWQSEDAINALLSIGIPAIGTAATFLVFYLLGTEAVARVRSTAKASRKYVDEPTDLVVITIDGVGEFILHRELDEALISKLLTATVDAISNAPVPERAVRIEESVK